MAGIAGSLRLVRAANDLSGPRTRVRGISSPWATSQLTQIVLSDIFGDVDFPVSRAEAMAVPAMARARNKVVGAIAGLPLKAYTDATQLPAQPAWLYRTNGHTSPQHRLAWTVDDLIFGGWSLWAVDRGAEGQVLDAVRVPAQDWSFGAGQDQEEDQVYVGGQPVDDGHVILIPGLHEGVLVFGARTIRGARNLEDAWAARSRNPIPAVELHQETDDELADDEIQEMVDDYQAALNRTEGAVVYTPRSVRLNVLGQMATDLLVEGRNASAIDVARDVGIPAAIIDASNVNSTLTYETLQGRNLQFRDDLSLYTLPIAARLSMDDVVPRGTRVDFDTTAFTQLPAPSSAGAPVED